MDSNLIKNITTRFLIGSLIALLILGMVVFSVLGIYMNRKSSETIHEVGEIYMTGMGDQLARHFENIIQLRFSQVEGIVSVVSTDHTDIEKLHEELIYRAQVRGFDHLSLCSSEGELETLLGAPIHAINLPPFLEALRRGEQRVAVGIDDIGNEVILFGITANYLMKSGEQCIGLVASIPLEYISGILSLEEDGPLMYCRIIRQDGSFVISNLNTNMPDYYNSVWEMCGSHTDESSIVTYLEGLRNALKEHKNYSSLLDVRGEIRQIYGRPLPYSEWYLIMIMPFGLLDQVINGLSGQRTAATLLACASILVTLVLIFLRYFSLTRLQFQELEKAQQTAIEATKAKSKFLSNMSHDIRTPMNAIVGMTAIATAHIDDQNQVQNCLRKIALSSKHLLGLINDVLDMSKIESGKMTLSMDQVSLKEVVEGIVSIVQPQVKAKRQKFDVHIENIVTENVCCDSVRLNQVLLNLLSNATKYTPEEGSIQLSVFEEDSPKGENYVRTHVKVKDNGIGMSPEFLKQIYESYSRADGTRVHKTEGAGLGMAITKYIIDAMGGTIEVQSELDKGTEFHIALDLEKATVTDLDMVLPPWNVLVVDDDELLCQTAADSLKSIGVKAEWTLSGEKAIQMAMEHHHARNDFQIILLDWKLPGMDGFQVAKELRRNLGDEIPILLISAYDWSEFESEARNAGISGFISKPLFKSTLFYGLRQYMGVNEGNDDVSEQDLDLSGRRILLAEDNELNWEIASELLSDLGVQLEWAEDGQICLDKFLDSPEGYYDAILMDIRMPIMTGYESTQAIRALDRSDASSIPIIAMTADAFSEDIQRCLNCGMNAHIAKPIAVSELARLLKKFFT
ncbi:response regulator [bacterium 1XD42-1]|nr:response regulator [bacterium 1XD42-8]RKJ64931.1 response regulator [bacterium 1XD42-1]